MRVLFYIKFYYRDLMCLNRYLFQCFRKNKFVFLHNIQYQNQQRIFKIQNFNNRPKKINIKGKNIEILINKKYQNKNKDIMIKKGKNIEIIIKFTSQRRISFTITNEEQSTKIIIINKNKQLIKLSDIKIDFLNNPFISIKLKQLDYKQIKKITLSDQMNRLYKIEQQDEFIDFHLNEKDDYINSYIHLLLQK